MVKLTNVVKNTMRQTVKGDNRRKLLSIEDEKGIIDEKDCSRRY